MERRVSSVTPGGGVTCNDPINHETQLMLSSGRGDAFLDSGVQRQSRLATFCGDCERAALVIGGRLLF
jgi:hypothetical protein